MQPHRGKVPAERLLETPPQIGRQGPTRAQPGQTRCRGIGQGRGARRQRRQRPVETADRIIRGAAGLNLMGIAAVDDLGDRTRREAGAGGYRADGRALHRLHRDFGSIVLLAIVSVAFGALDRLPPDRRRRDRNIGESEPAGREIRR